MDVAVGSENPVKIAATERALADRLTADVAGVAVDPAVPEQPRGHGETLAGARSRADQAVATGADLGVGIEGGVAQLSEPTGLFLVMWAAVTDGDRTGVGAGPNFRLPAAVADRVEADGELGPVMDELLDTDDLGAGAGAAGALTDGVVDRESSLVHAVAAAAGPFLTELY